MLDTRSNHQLIADYRLQQKLLSCGFLKLLARVELKLDLVAHIALGWCIANILVHNPIQSGAEPQGKRNERCKTAQ